LHLCELLSGFLPGSYRILPLLALSINARGIVVGNNLTSQLDEGFLRDPDGAISAFNIPDTAATLPLSINARGTVTGYSYPSATVSIYHSFLRSKAGRFTSFDVPGGTLTYASSINNFDVITGNYYKGSALLGFLRIP
jgi:hypothetical protein